MDIQINLNNPQIYIFNGTSSSGKTTLAKALLDRLDNSYTYLSLDNYIKSIFESYETHYPKIFENEKVISVIIPNLVLTFHDIINAFLMNNQNVIVDHVLQENEWKDDLFSKIKKYNVFIIGIYCSIGELEKRERERKDRKIGLAAYQFNRVHENMKYDIELNTEENNVEECINEILNKSIK